MTRTSNPVFRALGRWEEKGLLSSEVSVTLREEVEEELQRESRRWSQYALAATGGAILIIAGATFLTWAWPEMGYASQSVALAVIGTVVLTLGVRLLGKQGMLPVAFLLQISGPILLLMAFAYSENAWEDKTLGGVISGLLSLGVPFLTVWLALRKDPILGAIQASLSFLFFFLFLDRAFGLGMETSLWILDGVGLVGLLWLGFRLRSPRVPEWILNTFIALLYVSLVLIFFSGEVIFDMEEMVIIPADIWLLTVAGISLWALQDDAPIHLRRDWFERQLAYCIVIAIPFAFFTTLETMNAGANTAAITVGIVGALGLWFSIPRGSRPVLIASCLTVLIAAWYYGAEKAGALGAVLALTFMSIVLFWGSSRLAPARVGTEEVQS